MFASTYITYQIWFKMSTKYVFIILIHFVSLIFIPETGSVTVGPAKVSKMVTVNCNCNHRLEPSPSRRSYTCSAFRSNKHWSVRLLMVPVTRRLRVKLAKLLFFHGSQSTIAQWQIIDMASDLSRLDRSTRKSVFLRFLIQFQILLLILYKIYQQF